jgi:adenine deaminase
LGMKILIREGSAAKNLDNLMPLIASHPDQLMFCTDDCHPDYLLTGHINRMVARAIQHGFDLYDVLRIACINPVLHYNLPIGFPGVGQKADFVLVDDLVSFQVKATFIDGDAVFENDEVSFSLQYPSQPTFVFRKTFPENSLEVKATGSIMNVIRAIDGELVTLWDRVECKEGKEVKAQPENDLLKIVLLDRYSESPPVIAFISGFGLKQGALACSVAHDSHHVIAVGCDDDSLQSALQWIVQHRGGLCIAHHQIVDGIALPFYGLMTDKPCADVAEEYDRLGSKARSYGSVLGAPFMTLSFMALTVIPNLKINHNGLFDGIAFKNIDLFIP